MVIFERTSILFVSLRRSLTEPVEKVTHFSRRQSTASVSNTEYQEDVLAIGIVGY
jgi:hypothetical protein